jgi:hypothetical protein
MTKIITTIVLALGVLAVAGQANAAPVSGPSDFAIHGYLGTSYGK